jgi:hypothetical protein
MAGLANRYRDQETHTWFASRLSTTPDGIAFAFGFQRPRFTIDLACSQTVPALTWDTQVLHRVPDNHRLLPFGPDHVAPAARQPLNQVVSGGVSMIAAAPLMQLVEDLKG